MSFTNFITEMPKMQIIFQKKCDFQSKNFTPGTFCSSRDKVSRSS